METNTTALIVDDDRATQRLLADALAREGFAVLVEKDGEWALRTFQVKRIDVVILDLILPALHGFEVARRIRELPKGREVPILFLSGIYRSATHKAEARQRFNIVDFLEKPVNLGRLRSALREALGAAYPRPEAEEARRQALESVSSERVADAGAREEANAVEETARQRAVQSVRGPFSTKPFPELLAELYRWRATGALLMRRDTVKKIAYFHEGRPFSVKSNLLSECLGKLMLREKMIDEAECEESLRRMKESGRQQGTVLIEMGCISPHNLTYALSLQLQEKLYDIFGWMSGEYQFNPKAEIPAETSTIDLAPAQAIYEGIRRGYDDARVRTAMGKVEALYAHPAEDPLLRFQEIGLDDEEQSLISAIDGRKTVGTLLALGLLPPADALKLLYAMRCAQMIQLKAQPAAGPATARLGTGPDGARSEAYGPGPLEVPRASGRSAPPPSDSEVPAAACPPPIASDALAEKAAPQETGVREHLAGVLEAMKNKDYFEVLGVSPDASAETVRRVYLELAKVCHPDKHFGSYSAEVRALASQIFELISTAHDTLTDEAERERYLSELSRGVKKDLSQEVSNILTAEGKFQKGEDLLRRKEFKDAAAAFQEAVDLYGDEGEFRACLGWSLFQAEPGTPGVAEQAIREIESGIQLNPKVDKSYLYLGYIHKATGNPVGAEKQFEKAIQCNPNCTEALYELDLLGKRPTRS